VEYSFLRYIYKYYVNTCTQLHACVYTCSHILKCVCMRGREIEREREAGREAEKEAEREAERDSAADTERDRERGRKREKVSAGE